MSAFICVEFSSKNIMLNFSRFSGGTGFSILVGGEFVGGGGLAISVCVGYVIRLGSDLSLGSCLCL